MKLAAFVEYLPPRMGSDRRIYEIMKRLSSRHEVHFIVMPPFRLLCGKYSLQEGKFSLHLRNRQKKTEIQDGIIAHFVRMPKILFKLWKISYEVAFLLTWVMVFPKIVIAIKKINPERIILNYPSIYTGIFGLAVGKILGKSVVLDFNDLIAQYTVDFLELKKHSFKAKLTIFVQNLIAKKSNKIAASTRFIQNYALALRVSNKRIFLIPNGVDTTVFNPNRYSESDRSRFNAQKEKLCIYCGRVEEWAGINMIVGLSKMFQQKRPDVKFLIVGDGKKRVEKLQNVTVLREVSYEDIPAILACGDIVLVPFPRNEVSHAASPLKLFEGMAMEKPVVAGELSGTKEVIVNCENGILADPDDLNDWFESILRLVDNTSIAEEIGKKARLTVERNYTWDFIAKQFENMLVDKN